MGGQEASLSPSPRPAAIKPIRGLDRRPSRVDSLEFERNCINRLFWEDTRIPGPAARTDTANADHVFNSMDGFA
jgi:hypothetical protein